MYVFEIILHYLAWKHYTFTLPLKANWYLSPTFYTTNLSLIPKKWYQLISKHAKVHDFVFAL